MPTVNIDADDQVTFGLIVECIHHDNRYERTYNDFIKLERMAEQLQVSVPALIGATVNDGRTRLIGIVATHKRHADDPAHYGEFNMGRGYIIRWPEQTSRHNVKGGNTTAEKLFNLVRSGIEFAIQEGMDPDEVVNTVRRALG